MLEERGAVVILGICMIEESARNDGNRSDE